MEIDPPPGANKLSTEVGGQHDKLPDITAVVDVTTDVAGCFEEGTALIAKACTELIENASFNAQAATNLTTAMDLASQDNDVIEATAELSKEQDRNLRLSTCLYSGFYQKIMNTMGERVRQQKVR